MHDTRKSKTNYDFHVTDDELWRTMVKSGQATPTYDGLTPNYLEELDQGKTNYDFHVTDNPLWRTMALSTSSNGKQSDIDPILVANVKSVEVGILIERYF